MWTAVFGFIPAVESLKLEMRSLNVLVFSGLDMLQKLLLEQEATGSKGIATYFSGEVHFFIVPSYFHDRQPLINS